MEFIVQPFVTSASRQNPSLLLVECQIPGTASFSLLPQAMTCSVTGQAAVVAKFVHQQSTYVIVNMQIRTLMAGQGLSGVSATIDRLNGGAPREENRASGCLTDSAMPSREGLQSCWSVMPIVTLGRTQAFSLLSNGMSLHLWDILSPLPQTTSGLEDMKYLAGSQTASCHL